MMMTTIDKSAILQRIKGDSRKVGAKLAKELEDKNVEIVISDKKNEKNNVIERTKDADGKTTITLYEGNIGTENKEAIATYYLSLEATKMLIAQKSTTMDEEKVGKNAESLMAAAEVAYGVTNATEKDDTVKAQLTDIRSAIDTDVVEKTPELNTGNSDAVEVLATHGIIGLDSVEERAKNANATDVSTATGESGGGGGAGDATTATDTSSESTDEKTETTTKETSDKTVSPRAVLADASSNDSSTEKQVRLPSGTIISVDSLKKQLMGAIPEVTTDAEKKSQVEKIIGKLEIVSANDAKDPKLTNDITKLLTSNNLGNLSTPPATLASALAQPRSMVNPFLTPYSTATTTPLSTTFPTLTTPALSNIGYNAALWNGVQPRSVVNPSAFTPYSTGVAATALPTTLSALTTPALSNSGYNPALWRSNQQPSLTSYTNPSLFSTLSTNRTMPFTPTGFPTNLVNPPSSFA